MKRLKTGHIAEFVLWVAFAALLYSFTYDFDQEIEIYKFGASSWPRVILLLVVVAATGQLLYHLARGNGEKTTFASAADDGSGRTAAEQHHDTPRWYLATFSMLLIPLAYALVPEWIAAALSMDKAGLGTIKTVVALVLLVLFAFAARGNHVGAMLTLPILFAVGLQDFGFYTLAPVFILGVMYLMGERRPGRMLIIAAATYSVLLFLFVSVLYVGLPTGNVHPFYDFGTAMVTLLQ